MNLPNPIDECLLIPTSHKRLIRARYDEPERHYHNTEHICKIWNYYLQNNPGHHNWHERIKITTIFHDVIYEIGSTSNEIDSANYMISCLNVPVGTAAHQSSVFAEIYDTIVATADHVIPEHDDLPLWSKMFLDLDLYELGSDEATYKSNSYKLANEALNKYTVNEMLEGRKRWLVKMLDSPRIFRHFTDRETQARINIEQNLKELSA